MRELIYHIQYKTEAGQWEDYDMTHYTDLNLAIRELELHKKGPSYKILKFPMRIVTPEV